MLQSNGHGFIYKEKDHNRGDKLGPSVQRESKGFNDLSVILWCSDLSVDSPLVISP